MTTLVELSDQLWTGLTSTRDPKHHPFVTLNQVADWAVEADPDNSEAHRVRAEVYQARTEEAASTMSKGIFGAAARESKTKGGE